jgi:O-acetylserine/cysteine efflux transporter
MRFGIWLALLAAALWGLAPVATKGALSGYAPEVISVLRLGIAALLFRRLGGGTKPWLPSDRWSWIGGLALGTDFILYNYGLRLTTAGVSGLVVNVEVVSTIAFAVWLLGERLNRRRLLGSLITLSGVASVSSADAAFADLTARAHLVGNGMVMAAGICWSLFAVAQRRVPPTRNLFQLLVPIFTVAALTTTPLLLLPTAWRNPGGSLPTLMLLALIGLCTVTVYLAYARCQQLVDVSVLAIVLASIPVFAVSGAWLLLGEPISSRVLIGGTLILAGALVITTEAAPSEVLQSTAVERAP